MTADAKRLLRNSNGAVTMDTLRRRARAGERAALDEMVRRVSSATKLALIEVGMRRIASVGTPAARGALERFTRSRTKPLHADYARAALAAIP
jgi:hypothetical protein